MHAILFSRNLPILRAGLVAHICYCISQKMEVKDNEFETKAMLHGKIPFRKLTYMLYNMNYTVKNRAGVGKGSSFHICSNFH